ncbi:septum site-determining protein Ssd [Actinokineospora sp. UTMC 2448]|uniref:septum site-determining protein Ssd n=1 Tax=Actinokineospora sp. UTMC 2448 TaxID=2268449 RepID=UPI002164AF09|nr:septum site-determining protein Ssd [Actinokineospora sp. UTMC 2448]UVS76601.1 helicase/secretion neighborhood CpaE-like protein [Actinokineospora sp. UTMC 2448]
MSRPIACLRDESLADEVLRLAAVAQCPLDRVADPVELSARWSGPPLVLVDDPASCRGLPKRESLLVIHAGPPPTAFLSAAYDAGATRVVCLPDDADWLQCAFADAVESPAGRAGPVLAVVGGTGGAGASVFAAALALTALDAGEPTLLVDCDPLSGGLDLVLGTETTPGVRWPDIRLSSGRVSAASLHAALPGRTKGNARLTILSGARAGEGPTADAVSAVVAAGRRTGETVICDLPRHPTEATRSALSSADLVAMVVPADIRSCAAAHRTMTTLRDHGAHPALVIRGPSPSRLTPQEIAKTLSTRLLAKYTFDRDLPRLIDQGLFHPRPSLTRAAKTVLRELTPNSPRASPTPRHP